MNNLENELTTMLNSYNQEAESDTPDFILSQYMLSCLRAFECAVRAREGWYGRPRPERRLPVEDARRDLIRLREVCGTYCERLPLEVREVLHSLPDVEKTHGCKLLTMDEGAK